MQKGGQSPLICIYLCMLENQIEDVRYFNRFYTSVIGVLNRHFLDSKYSLPELRVIHEISLKDGVTASEIKESLKIDKSYLSRIILRFEKSRIIIRETSAKDARAVHLHLTPAGKKLIAEVNKISQQQVKEILKDVKENDRKELVIAMKRIIAILTKQNPH